MFETTRHRYHQLTTMTPITDRHREDYAHLMASCENDLETMFVWQMHYLRLLAALGADQPAFQQPNLVPGRRYVITHGPNIGQTVTFITHTPAGEMVVELPMAIKITGQWQLAPEGHKLDLWYYRDGLVRQTRGAISLNPSLQDIWETEDGESFRDDWPGGGLDRATVYTWAIDRTKQDILYRRQQLSILEERLPRLQQEATPARMDGPACPIEQYDPFANE